MTDLLSEDAAAQAWAAFEQAEPAREYKHFRPFSDAISDFERDATAVNRVHTGIPEFDEQMRGVSGSQLLTIYGHSQSGKSLVANHVVRYNRHKRCLYITADEDSSLVLAKFASAETGISGREFEDRLARHDPEAKKLLRQVAEEEYPNLCVVHGFVDSKVMKTAFEECCDAWGAAPEFMVFDYLDLLSTGEDTARKMNYIKAFGQSHDVPFILLHQTSRSGGAEGKELTATAAAYSGESQSTYMIGVRRKKYALMAERAELRGKIAKGAVGAVEDRLALVSHDLNIHEFTVTVNLTKCKRVGGALVDEIDMELGVGTGRLFRLEGHDLPVQYRRQRPPVRFGPESPPPYEQQEF